MFRVIARAGLRSVSRGVSMRPVAAVEKRWLSASCGKELEDEQAFFEEMEKPEMLSGWSMTHTDGSGYFRLTKDSEGTEILIDCEFKAHDTEEDSTGFSVIMTQNGVTADFTLRYSEGNGSYTLEGMTTYKTRSSATDLTPQAGLERDNNYEGPTIEDLEKTEVVEKVIDMLVSKGITSDLAAFVHKQCQVLEQKAYMGFLTDLQNFAK
eukprot:TRINITY_DN920_c3_g1_i1.p1 TRINITY_DN920_c3_g1~~TRINITY_DN920_c3_g1_i1.p1  ORF type:complete len:209 (+),score=77.37 TRINITY_DN920_c3_g1_i1:58-684(+)